MSSPYKVLSHSARSSFIAYKYSSLDLNGLKGRGSRSITGNWLWTLLYISFFGDTPDTGDTDDRTVLLAAIGHLCTHQRTHQLSLRQVLFGGEVGKDETADTDHFFTSSLIRPIDMTWFRPHPLLSNHSFKDNFQHFCINYTLYWMQNWYWISMPVMPKGVTPRGGQGLAFSATLHGSGEALTRLNPLAIVSYLTKLNSILMFTHLWIDPSLWWKVRVCEYSTEALTQSTCTCVPHKYQYNVRPKGVSQQTHFWFFESHFFSVIVVVKLTENANKWMARKRSADSALKTCGGSQCMSWVGLPLHVLAKTCLHCWRCSDSRERRHRASDRYSDKQFIINTLRWHTFALIAEEIRFVDQLTIISFNVSISSH